MGTPTIRRSILAVFTALLLFAVTAFAQAGKPISKKGLIDALMIGGLTQQELGQFVQQRGVDFQPNAFDDAELRKAGASEELLKVVKANYKGPILEPASTKTASKPLTKAEVVTLLQVGTPSTRIIQLAKERGINFRLTPDVKAELEGAGADGTLLGVLNNMHPTTNAPAAAPSKKLPPLQRALTAEAEPPAQSPAPPPTAPSNALLAAAPPPQPEASRPPSAPKVASLREVKTIFVDKMPNDLDQFIRAEITKQMAGRLSVTLVKEDADAIITGVSDAKTGTGSMITGRYLGLHDTASGAISVVDPTGSRVFWSEEAGDRSLLLGPMKRSGPRKVADRLVSKLKHAMQ